MHAPELLDEFLAGPDFVALIDSPERVKHRYRWRQFVNELQVLRPSSAKVVAGFHVQWHVCHHRLRELVNDDGALLDAVLAWLPPYLGGGLTLYRGENSDRFDQGKLGWAWSTQVETATMFAKGLNAVGSGGMLLCAEVDASAIIAGPSTHSMRIDEFEFTVDPRKVSLVDVIARFPPLR
jgi:hypothetical protein